MAIALGRQVEPDIRCDSNMSVPSASRRERELAAPWPITGGYGACDPGWYRFVVDGFRVIEVWGRGYA
jgi:hypothetical protein